MEIYDLNTLAKDLNQDNLYNFFVLTFKKYTGGELGVISVEPQNDMRIDLVCQSIYGSIDYCDILLNLNDVVNPLNIIAGDIFVFPPVGIIPEYRVKDSNTENARARLLNSRKSSRQDPNRRRFVEENPQLPPNLLPTPAPAVRIEGNELVIGG